MKSSETIHSKLVALSERRKVLRQRAEVEGWAAVRREWELITQSENQLLLQQEIEYCN